MARQFQRKPRPGNIKSATLTSTWPNGRKFKHGAMVIKFSFPPNTVAGAEAEIEQFMHDNGLTRSVDYHIPAWNHTRYQQYDFYTNEMTITFVNDEVFVMTKMGWGMDTDDT
jgi:hypothetical protein